MSIGEEECVCNEFLFVMLLLLTGRGDNCDSW